MVATASPEPKTEKVVTLTLRCDSLLIEHFQKATCGVHYLPPQQAIISPKNVSNLTGNYQNISLTSSFPLDDVLLWTNQDPRESVLFHSWGIFYRFKVRATFIHRTFQ